MIERFQLVELVGPNGERVKARAGARVAELKAQGYDEPAAKKRAEAKAKADAKAAADAAAKAGGK